MKFPSLLLLATVVLAIASGYFVLRSGQTTNSGQVQSDVSQSQPQSSAPQIQEKPVGIQNNENVVIEYTEDGFQPKMITIPLDTTVRWINRTSRPMWIASAVHPTHQELPGFDALKGYATGESYSYTFTKIGSWKYHDHLNPKATGEVIVE
ncbi:MAG TPA: hypothetical protein VJB91_00080 [Patescibacteria group bacterium]|nr:hypothetical protein [Patescibacteria group bacterium]